MKLEDYMNELAEYDMVEFFGDYDSGYISDIISEIADSEVSIYTQDQIDFAMNNDDAVEEAFFSGIAPDGSDWFNRNGNDFRGYVAAVGAAAWYEQNSQTLYQNMEKCVKYATICAIKEQYGIEELTDEQISDFESLVEFDDNNAYLQDVIEDAARVLGLIEEEE